MLKTKNQGKLCKILVAICGRDSIFAIVVPYGPLLRQKKIIKIQHLKISKIWKIIFVTMFKINIHEKYEKIQEWFVGGSSFLQFWPS